MEGKRPCDTVDKFKWDSVDGFDIEVEGDFEGNLGNDNYKDKALFSDRDKKKVLKEMALGRTLFEAVKNVAGRSVKVRKCYLIEKRAPPSSKPD